MSKIRPCLVGQLWEAMDKGGFSYTLECDVKKFNGWVRSSMFSSPTLRGDMLDQGAKK